MATGLCNQSNEDYLHFNAVCSTRNRVMKSAFQLNNSYASIKSMLTLCTIKYSSDQLKQSLSSWTADRMKLTGSVSLLGLSILNFFFMTSTIIVDHFLTLTRTTAPTTAAERFCLFILMLPVCWFTYVGSFWLWWHLHRNLQRNCRKLPHHNLDGSADTGPWLDRSCQVWIDPGCHGNRRAGRSSLARWAGRGIRWNI